MRQTLLATVLGCVLPGAIAATHPLKSDDGLKRFELDKRLRSADEPQQVLTSQLELREVKIADNVLQKAIELHDAGGQLHTITGGTRSDKLSFSFFQEYQDSRLEQKIELHFNKYSGLIDEINLRYFIASAYLSIAPLRSQVINAAVAKYGPPLSLTEVREQLNQSKGTVRFSHYIAALKDLSADSRAYLQKMNVTKNGQITADQEGHAVFQSGFDYCYLWPRDNFNEVLRFCSFAANAANANSRGLEFSLHNFRLARLIEEQQKHSRTEAKISL